MKHELPYAHRSDHVVRHCWMLICGLALLMLASYAILRTSAGSARGNEMNRDRAIFSVVSAATLTGFTQPTNPEHYKPFGQAAIFVVVSAASIVWLVVGGWALVRIVNMPVSDEQIVRGSIIAFGLAVLIGMAALLRDGAGMWQAAFESAGAFGNFGLALGSAPRLADWRTHAVILPLSVLGGFGIAVLIDLAGSIVSIRRPHPHSVAVLFSSACIYLLGMGLILLLAWLDAAGTQRAAVTGSLIATDSRSLGMHGGLLTSLSRAGQWIVLALMAIGASPAGTGGGIKGTTLLVLMRETTRLITGQAAQRILGFAILWTGIYILAVLVTTGILLWLEPQTSADRLLFVAVSAAGNVGLSHEPITLGAESLIVLSIAMLIGRAVPLALLWWMVRNGTESDVAVG